MAKERMVTVFVGGYDDISPALRDFDDIRELHLNKSLGAYEAALVKKEESGKVIVAKVTGSKRGSDAAKGTVAGGVVGVLFPPSVVGGALVGGIGGAMVGGAKKPLDRSDIHELGDLLPEGGTGVVLVTDDADDDGLDYALQNAPRKTHMIVEPDADSIKTAIAQAVLVSNVARL